MTDPINTKSKTGDLGPSRQPVSTIGIIPQDSCPRGEGEARGAEEEYIKLHVLAPVDIEAPTLTLENLESLGRKDPIGATLASVVARSDCLSLPPSVTRPDPAQGRLARTKVREWPGEELAGTIKTWGE